MQSIPFSKMSVNGNNFVILDETQYSYLNEPQKSEFAYYATNSNFGVGCDNMLVVQECTDTTIETIASARKYWEHQPTSTNADYIFRMFEPNGEEALSCGNGLKCIACYLFSRYGLKRAEILTEIPLERPRAVTIGTRSNSHVSWVNLGVPRRVPESLYCPQNQHHLNEQIDYIEKILVKFRKNDLSPYTTDNRLSLSGYLVFTGEPHLVVLNSGLSVPELSHTLFTASKVGRPTNDTTDKRVNFGSSLIQLVGSIVNKTYRHLFPAGININFVNYLEKQRIVEYRCFERGIEKETLACGTGALAVAFVLRQLQIIKDQTITVWPHCCRYYQSDAELIVEEKPEGWVLSSRPKYLFSGNYHFTSAYDQLGEMDNRVHSQYYNDVVRPQPPDSATAVGL
jgi:diaminopimelate epimerase